MGSLGLEHVRARISLAAARSGRTAADVTLVAVSKGRDDDRVALAYAEGQRVFGENRQQGLEHRVEADLPSDISWHFIGPLQSRKARFVGANATLLHSFDRLGLISRWKDSGTPVLLQFNVAAEPQKVGFVPSEAEPILTAVLDEGIDVRGVMAIPPITDDPEETRQWFAMLRGIFETYRLMSDRIDTLSMGMTNDFEAAIEEGATMVRVGRAIFEPHIESEYNRNG
jgi:pyridoxal phosphate enzyme (YggS family)